MLLGMMVVVMVMMMIVKGVLMMMMIVGFFDSSRINSSVMVMGTFPTVVNNSTKDMSPTQ